MSDRHALRVASPPHRPIMVWDGQCGFCAHWVERWKRKTGTAVEYIPFQEISVRFPEISLQSHQASVHLIEPNGDVTAGAEAAFRALAYGKKRKALWLYRHLPGFAFVCEWGYRAIAKHRGSAFKITRALIKLRLLK